MFLWSIVVCNIGIPIYIYVKNKLSNFFPTLGSGEKVLCRCYKFIIKTKCGIKMLVHEDQLFGTPTHFTHPVKG